MGLTQIDLIKQIYYFFRGFRNFRESHFHIAAGAADGAENLYNRINLCEPNTYLHLTPDAQPRSGCNLNNPMLTISEAQSATWGQRQSPQ